MVPSDASWAALSPAMQGERPGPRVLIVMGVSGSGKTTIGLALAEALGWPFFEGDDYHPPENVEKMGRGEPLTEQDRQPWLDRLRGLIEESRATGRQLVLASSALRQRYRDQLAGGDPGVWFVYLRGDYETIRKRMRARRGHFMKPALLRSQFETLEEPEEAIIVDLDAGVPELVAEILDKLA